MERIRKEAFEGYKNLINLKDIIKQEKYYKLKFKGALFKDDIKRFKKDWPLKNYMIFFENSLIRYRKLSIYEKLDIDFALMMFSMKNNKEVNKMYDKYRLDRYAKLFELGDNNYKTATRILEVSIVVAQFWIKTLYRINEGLKEHLDFFE